MKTKSSLIFIVCLALSCARSGEQTGDVEKPSLKKECLSGKCVTGQFETPFQRFALITGNVVNMRSHPDLTSHVIVQLPVTRKVTVLYVKPGETTIGGMKGTWAFVSDSENISRQGWVFDHFLGFVDCFKKPGRWTIREIRVILGGKLTVYRCAPDLTFSVVQDEKIYKKDGKAAKDKSRGTILQCKNVIWLNKETPDDRPVFFHILDDGTLALPDQYKNARGIVLVK